MQRVTDENRGDPQFCVKTSPESWVCGYMLDLCGKCRGWCSVISCQCRSSAYVWLNDCWMSMLMQRRVTSCSKYKHWSMYKTKTQTGNPAAQSWPHKLVSPDHTGDISCCLFHHIRRRHRWYFSGRNDLYSQPNQNMPLPPNIMSML